MPTLRQLLQIKPSKKQLEANRQGILTAGQLDYLWEKHREIQTRTRNLNMLIVGEFILLFFVASGAFVSNQLPFALIGIMFIITFFIIATTYYRRRSIHDLKYWQADLETPRVVSVTGIPAIEFEEGKAYVDIDGVRFPAREKYVIGYKTKTIYTVYCTPNTHIPLSYEKVEHSDSTTVSDMIDDDPDVLSAKST